MQIPLVIYVLGKLLFWGCPFFLVPLFLGLYFDENIFGFLGGFLITFCLSGNLYYTAAKKIRSKEIGIREGIAITGIGWLVLAFLGMLPFWLGGYLSLVDSIFEAMSGLSGLGATVFSDLASLPHAVLFWRSFLHWIGGLGIIVIFVALLPKIGSGAMHVLNSELAGPSLERVFPRIQDMAKALFRFYAIFTLVSMLILFLCGLPFLEAVNHAMSAIATGGFSTHDDSIAYFDSAIVEFWLIIIMAISAGSYQMYVKAWYRGGLSVIKENTEFRFYIFWTLLLGLLVSINLILTLEMPFFTAVRYSFFQAFSLSSSTGFVTADFDAWPPFSKLLLLLLMFVGGCAGSTSGGLKISRLIILLKGVYLFIERNLHPQMTGVLELNGKKLSDEVFFSVGRYFFFWMLLIATSSLLLIFDGMTSFDAISAAVSATANVGPGFGVVGATCTYADLSSFSKLVLCMSLYLGRLEAFTVLVMVLPDFWRRTW